MSRTPNHTYSSIEPRVRVLMDHEMMRDVLADVGGMRTALELEMWASWMLGQIWKQRARQPHFCDVDWMLTLGAPMVGMIAEIGGARTRKALTAISQLERGALGDYAGRIALTLPGARTPAWMAQMGDARFAAARYGASDGDGEAVLLDLHRGGAHELTVAVFMDARRDGAVKWIRLLGPVAAVPTASDNSWELLQPADLDEVSRRVHHGIEQADRDTRHDSRREFADLRAFLLARLDPAPAQSGVV